jgi:hypothetical protein
MTDAQPVPPIPRPKSLSFPTAGTAPRHPLLVLGLSDTWPRTLERSIAGAVGLRGRLTIVAVVDQSIPWWAALATPQFAIAHSMTLALAEEVLGRAVATVPADMPVASRLLLGPLRSYRQILEALIPGVHDAIVLDDTYVRSRRCRADAARLRALSPVPVIIDAELLGAKDDRTRTDHR